jgi:hypothetical protein
MKRLIEWRYVGTPESPEMIRIGGQNVFKGACLGLPEDFDFTKAHGTDIRQSFRLELASPPADPLKPIGDTLDGWQEEVKKHRPRFIKPSSDRP